MTNEKKKPTGVSRRQFVGTVATAAGVTIVPRHVLGAGFQAPSDTVNVAIVGYSHGMGTNNLFNVAKTDNIVALCDCDESAAAKEAMKRRGTLEKFPKAVQHKDYRVMLEKQKDIDAVLVATPDHTHAVIAMAAMQLGKHVYVQKPLTRTVSEARALTEAARKYKVVTQMGNQGHSEEGLRLMQEWLEAGALGQVREVYCWTNRPIWPQGMPRPTDTQGVPDGFNWEMWIGPSPIERRRAVTSTATSPACMRPTWRWRAPAPAGTRARGIISSGSTGRSSTEPPTPLIPPAARVSWPIRCTLISTACARQTGSAARCSATFTAAAAWRRGSVRCCPSGTWMRSGRRVAQIHCPTRTTARSPWCPRRGIPIDRVCCSSRWRPSTRRLVGCR